MNLWNRLIICFKPEKQLSSRSANGQLKHLDPSVSYDGEMVCVIPGPDKALRGCICGQSRSSPVNVDLIDVGYSSSYPLENIFIMPSSFKTGPPALNHKFKLDVLPPDHMFAFSNQKWVYLREVLSFRWIESRIGQKQGRIHDCIVECGWAGTSRITFLIESQQRQTDKRTDIVTKNLV